MTKAPEVEILELEQRLEECEKEFARQLERLSDLKTKDCKEKLERIRNLVEGASSAIKESFWFKRLKAEASE